MVIYNNGYGHIISSKNDYFTLKNEGSRSNSSREKTNTYFVKMVSRRFFKVAIIFEMVSRFFFFLAWF